MPFTPEFMQSTSRFRRYCENELVNLLCSSFAEKAQQHGIRLTAELRLPAALSIPDTELCTVLSNGLENAFRAVSGLDEQQRTVSLYCGVRLNKLLLEIKNPYQARLSCARGFRYPDRAGHGTAAAVRQAIAAAAAGLLSAG